MSGVVRWRWVPDGPRAWSTGDQRVQLMVWGHPRMSLWVAYVLWRAKDGADPSAMTLGPYDRAWKARHKAAAFADEMIAKGAVEL